MPRKIVYYSNFQNYSLFIHMYDIFLSYSSKDRSRLQPLAHILKQQGWAVFWDHETIHTGEDWHQKIEMAINGSRCVIVAWSRHSVSSEWVLAEASRAKQRNVLLPIKIEEVALPLEFTRRQTADFSTWDETAEHPAFIELTIQIERLLGNEKQTNTPPPNVPKESIFNLKLVMKHKLEVIMLLLTTLGVIFAATGSFDLFKGEEPKSGTEASILKEGKISVGNNSPVTITLSQNNQPNNNNLIDIHIKGKVYNEATGNGINKAVVMLPKYGFKAETNEEGVFDIQKSKVNSFTETEIEVQLPNGNIVKTPEPVSPTDLNKSIPVNWP